MNYKWTSKMNLDGEEGLEEGRILKQREPSASKLALSP